MVMSGTVRDLVWHKAGECRFGVSGTLVKRERLKNVKEEVERTLVECGLSEKFSWQRNMTNAVKFAKIEVMSGQISGERCDGCNTIREDRGDGRSNIREDRCDGCDKIREDRRDMCKNNREDRSETCCKICGGSPDGLRKFANKDVMSVMRSVGVETVSSFEVHGQGQTTSPRQRNRFHVLAPVSEHEEEEESECS